MQFSVKIFFYFRCVFLSLDSNKLNFKFFSISVGTISGLIGPLLLLVRPVHLQY